MLCPVFVAGGHPLAAPSRFQAEREGGGPVCGRFIAQMTKAHVWRLPAATCLTGGSHVGTFNLPSFEPAKTEKSRMLNALVAAKAAMIFSPGTQSNVRFFFSTHQNKQACRSSSLHMCVHTRRQCERHWRARRARCTQRPSCHLHWPLAAKTCSGAVNHGTLQLDRTSIPTRAGPHQNRRPCHPS